MSARFHPAVLLTGAMTAVSPGRDSRHKKCGASGTASDGYTPEYNAIDVQV